MSGREDITCRELVELVSDYLEGRLPEPDRVLFDAHLAVCEDCRTYVEQMRALAAATARMDAEALEPASRDALLDAFRGWKRERGL